MSRIDSHSHFDMIYNTDLVNTLREKDISLISWAYTPNPPRNISDFKFYFANQYEKCQHGRDSGLNIYRTVGIHPRSIPANYNPETPDNKIYTLLRDAVKQNDVVGIGEIGLETGDDNERSIFRAQLKFAEKSNLPVCIHTPRNDKERITDITIGILDQYDLDPKKVIIDHITDKKILEDVLKKGYYVGITISNSKASLEDASSIIEAYKKYSDRIMTNSDVVSYNPEEYQMFLDLENHLKPGTESILADTARNFFKIIA